MEQDKEVRAYIRRLAADVAKGKLNAIELQHRLCELCERVRRKGLMCELHKAVYPALELCKTCP
jgi:predicted transcriptional regulator